MNQEQPGLASSVFAKNVTIVRHADIVNLMQPDGGAPVPIATEASYDGMEQVKRSILAGAGAVRIGDWIVQVGSAASVNLNFTANYSGSPDFQTLLRATRQIQDEIRSDSALQDLQDYMNAVLRASAQSPYQSLQDHIRKVADYVALFGRIPKSEHAHEDVVIPDAAMQIGAWLSENPSAQVHVEGKAGAGKSTILQRLAACAWDEPANVGLSTRHLPMLVRLRHLARASGTSAEERLWAAVGAANELLIARRPPSPGFMHDWSQRMSAPWLLLLDGFDELDEKERRKLRLWITQLRETTDHRVVITARQFSVLGLQADQRQARNILLADLSDSQKWQFSERILGDAATRFRSELDSAGLAAGIATPLDTTIAALVYRLNGQLPLGRARLIYQFIKMRVEEAELHDIDDEIAPSPLLPILENMALAAVHKGGTTEVALEAIMPFFTGTDRLLAEIKAEQVLNAISRRSGVVRIEAGLIAWSHNLFADVLAARSAARRTLVSSPEAVATAIEWSDIGWWGPLCLLLAIWSDPESFGLQPSSKGVTAAIEAILGDDAGAVIRAVDIAPAFLDGARASEAVERKIGELLTGKLEPFGEINFCARVFFSGRDTVLAVEELSHLPRFRGYFENLVSNAAL